MYLCHSLANKPLLLKELLMKTRANSQIISLSVFPAIAAVMMLTGQSSCQEQDRDEDDWTVEQGDCDDRDASSYPGAPELCDAADNDCNDAIDDGNVCTSCTTETHGMGTYQFCSSGRSWAEALSTCEGFGYTLASITDSLENDFVSNTSADLGLDDVWIGLNDQEVEGTWVWVSGEEVEFTSWNAGEPSDTVGNENCVGAHWSGANWNDEACTELNEFVCEIP